MKKSTKKYKFQSVGGKTYKENSISLRGQRLKAVVKAYQRGNAGAAELLRKSYFPLVYKFAHKPSVAGIFNEDAENEVWIIFYSLVKEYKGENFRNFPATIKQLMELRLNTVTKNYCSKTNQETSVSDKPEVFDIEAPDTLDPVLSNVAISNAIDKLSKEQQEIIKYMYFTNLTQKQIAERLGCSDRQLRRLKVTALKLLQIYLN